MEGTVYSITNLANGMIYVGRTARPVEHRFNEHILLLRRNAHKNQHLQDDFNKYGESYFAFTVLGQDHDRPFTEDSEEKRWMEKLETYNERYGYNELDPASVALRRKHGLPKNRWRK